MYLNTFIFYIKQNKNNFTMFTNKYFTERVNKIMHDII